MSMRISIEEHPLLELESFEAEFSTPIGELVSPDSCADLLTGTAENVRDDETKAAVRRMLRHGGYRPAGRGKPASEFLVQASEKGILSAINPPVDACNIASLWGGLPISVVDADLASGSLSVSIPPEGSSYVFNASGQEITLTGLLCLHDEVGPCANAVKDSQRTKTHPGTTRVLAVVWGTSELPGRASEVADRFRGLLTEAGARVQP